MRMNLKSVTNKVLLLTMVFFMSVVVLSLPVQGGEKKPAIERANMNLSVSPGEDFFEYANGGFNARLKMPDDQVSYGVMNILREKRDKAVLSLLESAAKMKSPKPGSAVQKIGDFYGIGMDIKKINADGLKPLKDELAMIEKIASISDFQEVLTYLHTHSVSVLFNWFVEMDLKDNSRYSYYLMQGGLGLPDRDYYTKDDARSKEIRVEYVKHLARMFEVLGDKPETATANAATVMSMELRLAKSSKTLLEARNIRALYNPMELKKLHGAVPDFDWNKYFKTINAGKVDYIIVGMPKFLTGMASLMKEAPLKDWKTYLRWHLIKSSSDYLSAGIVRRNHSFFEEFLSGSKKIKERWKRVVETTNEYMGELVGQLYAEKYFPPEAKKKMVGLIANLKTALTARIEKLEWMSDSTKKEALAKLKQMKVKIGYPDKWIDYSKLEIKRDSYLQNVRRAGQFSFNRSISRLGKPIDMTEWNMTPQTVNAMHHPMRNDITFPAGILQPPYFNNDADDAINYGAIGVVIGHEMTHGFDDQGRRFNKNGIMTDWWTKKDEESFKKRTQLLVDQYGKFHAIDDVYLDGKLTLGENIADFAGLTVSYQAYQMSLKGKKIPEPIDGFTHTQRFFLSYAQIWRGKIRDKALKRKCREDVHPWGKFRVNGPLFNVPEFYENFDIKPSDKLYRSEKQRPVIW
ncbi:MAG: M13 family metallopeptidase [bacterium]|nr:M13 family metallopeptidase [bacterium]